MRGLLAVMLLMALSSCGGDGGGAAGAKSEPESSPPAELTLLDACPRVEAAMGDVSGLSTPDEFTPLLDELRELHESADLETRNALEILLETTEWVVEVGRKGDSRDGNFDQELKDFDRALTASSQWNGDVKQFARRCKAAGSTALLDWL